MKIKKSYLSAIIKEELANLVEDKGIKQSKEKRLAEMLFALITKAREEFEDYLGELGEEKPSDECGVLYDNVSKMWALAHDMIGGGETPKEFVEPLHEKKINESLEGTLLALNKLKGFLKEKLEVADHNEVNSLIVELGEELQDALKPKERVPGSWRAGEEKSLEPSERSIPPKMGGPSVRYMTEQKDKTK